MSPNVLGIRSSTPLLLLALWYALFMLILYYTKNYVNTIYALLCFIYLYCYLKLPTYLPTIPLFLTILRITFIIISINGHYFNTPEFNLYKPVERLKTLSPYKIIMNRNKTACSPFS